MKSLLVGARAPRAAAWFKPRGAAILMYHSIAENPAATSDGIGVSQSREAFEAHMRELARRFQPVTVERIARFAAGEGDLPPRAVAVTFDDGFLDNYELALPILERYGIPATFYILAGAVDRAAPPWYCRIRRAFSRTPQSNWADPVMGRRFSLTMPESRQEALQYAWNAGAAMTGAGQEEFVRRIENELETFLPAAEAPMMTWDQVRRLRKAGHIAGAHTMSHPNLAHIPLDEVEREVTQSKARLEAELGEPVDHFSYPHPALNPQWNAATMEALARAGYKSAALTTSGLVRRGDSPLALRRIYAADALRQWTWNLEITFLGARA